MIVYPISRNEKLVTRFGLILLSALMLAGITVLGALAVVS